MVLGHALLADVVGNRLGLLVGEFLRLGRRQAVVGMRFDANLPDFWMVDQEVNHLVENTGCAGREFGRRLVALRLETDGLAQSNLSVLVDHPCNSRTRVHDDVERGVHSFPHFNRHLATQILVRLHPECVLTRLDRDRQVACVVGLGLGDLRAS